MSPLGFGWGRKAPRTPRRRAPAAPKRTWGATKPRTPTVRTLAAKVAKISRTVKAVTSEITYSQSVSPSAIGNAGGTNVFIQPLSVYANWTRIFGTDADDESNHSALWKKTVLDLQIDAGTERNSIDYAFYVVSLTKLGQEELFTPSSGGLAGPLGITSLTNATHFVQGGGSTGMALLNKKYFNIHHCRRIITGSGGSVAYETQSLRKRWMVKLYHNGGKGHRLQNPKGDWKAIPSPQPANQNLYILIFNNDSTADDSVKFKMLALNTLQVS